MRFAVSFMSALLLVACGGSGGGSPSPAVPGGTLELFAGMTGRDASSLGFVDGHGAAARFANSVNITADRAGNVYVVDRDNHAIREITPQGDVSTLLVRNVVGETLLGIAVDPAGTVYFGAATCQVSPGQVSCQGALYRISPAHEALAVVPQSNSDSSGLEIVYPGSLAFDMAGNLYVSDEFASASCSVRRLAPSGDFTRVASTCGSLAVATDGAVYLARGTSVARIVNGVVSDLVVSTGVSPSDPTFSSVAVGAHGDLYAVDGGLSIVRKVAANGTTTIAAGTPTIELPGLGRFVPGPLPGELDHPGAIAITNSVMYVSMPHAIAVIHDFP